MFKSAKGYFLTILCGLWVFAMGWLVLGNWGNQAQAFHVYWKTYTGVGLGFLMGASGVGGVVTYWMVKWLIRGIRLIRRGRMDAMPSKIHKMEKEAQKAQANS